MLRIFLIILLLNLSILAQWQNVCPTATSSDISCLRILNESKFIFCTQQGEIFVTEDGGASWEKVFADHRVRFNKLFFLNESGWALPWFGTNVVFRTQNGGYSWYEQIISSDTTAHTSVFFYNDSLGFVGKGGVLYRTNDGGSTWENITDTVVIGFRWLQDIYMKDRNNIFICGTANTLLRSSNGGESWYLDMLPDSCTEIGGYEKIFFTDSITGYIVADEENVLKTNDGGITWFSKRSSHNNGQYFTDGAFRADLGIFFFRPNQELLNLKIIKDIVFPEQSNISNSLYSNHLLYPWSLRTFDGGETWNNIEFALRSRPSTCDFVNDSTVILGGTFGALMKSSDFADHCVSLNNFRSHGYVASPVMFDNDNGFFLTFNNITRTTDGGNSFTYIPYNFSGYTINCFTATDSNTFYIGTYNGKILKSTDRGITWAAVPINVPEQHFIYKIQFINKRVGYAAAYSGLFKTTDAGDSWLHLFTTNSSKMDFIDSLEGWWTSEGNIYHTTDGAISWSDQGFHYAEDISFADSKIGITKTDYNKCKFTIDGGETWLNSFIEDNYIEIYEVKIIKVGEKIHGYIGCRDGSIYYSADSGNTWKREIFYASGVINEFAFGGNTIWATSFDRAFILKNTIADNIIPVGLISFTGEIEDGTLILKWRTSTEINNKGFEIQRRTKGRDWEARGFIKGNGTATETNEYFFSDKLIESGKYSYRLSQLDLDGSSEFSNILVIEYNVITTEFSLYPNFPNPFNPSTTIKYSLPEQSRITIIIYDALGREINKLVDEETPAGVYEVQWNAENHPSGVYFCRMKAGNYSETRKLILMK